MDPQVAYIAWQNHSYRFYLAARLLYINGLCGPAAYCANQAIEIILKATLVYWDKSFDPKKAGHRIKAMIRAVFNKVPQSKSIEIPEYFYAEKRYQTNSRYPERGIMIPNSFLIDLDALFLNLIRLVPFQFNSNLVNSFKSSNAGDLDILTMRNELLSDLKKFLNPWIEYPGPRKPLPKHMEDLLRDV